MSTHDFIQHMPEVDEYRTSLNNLSERWDLLTLLGQMSNIGTDMTETRHGFEELTDRLLDRLGHESLVKLTSEMEAKAQVAVDIVIRNLFERTADIGFLATDDDIRRFIRDEPGYTKDDEGRKQRKEAHHHIVERFREYVAKYSVYENIILLDPSGKVLAQLDESNDISSSHDSIIRESIDTNHDYVECYRASDLNPTSDRSLIYSFRVTDSNEQDSDVLGVLCLVFKFEDEMKGVFEGLIEDSDWMEITLLDSDGVVISSSDQYHIPIGARLSKVTDKDYKIVRFGGREYLAKTCETQGYEGYFGLGWCGHVMVPVDSAFKRPGTSEAHKIDQESMKKVVTGSTLFSEDLVDIPKRADRIQHELDATVWNGNVQIANTKSGDNSFSKTLLNEISKTGVRTKKVFEDSISNLNQTVISSYLDVAEFHSKLALDIMDRNLYERANDCRWWALTSRFREILSTAGSIAEHKEEMCNILAYINNLYTVYTNLFIYDKSGTIQAVSKPEEQHLIGRKLTDDWVSQTLSIRDSQKYSVSSFSPSYLYGDNNTYIYGASITDKDTFEVRGGIGIVFDSQPQFKEMLSDALPKNETGHVLPGCFGLFVERNGNIVTSTDNRYATGGKFLIEEAIANMANGNSVSKIVELEGKYYVVGAKVSSGYREYKVSDNYSNDIISLVYLEIGVCQDITHSTENNLQISEYDYPQVQGGEESIELSTFMVGNRLFGMESKSIVCSLNNQEITLVPGSDERYLGIISFMRESIPVVSLRSELDAEKQYNKDEDCIIIAKKDADNGDEVVGLVIDQVVASPEIPVRLLSKCDAVTGGGGNRMTKYIVQPERGNERSGMLLILDMDSISNAVLRDKDEVKHPYLDTPVLVKPEEPVQALAHEA